MVVASVGECPLTVLEAMSSGLPVRGQRRPGAALPLDRRPGRAVRRHGRRATSAAPSRSWSRDPRRDARMGAEGTDFVRASFSWEAHLDRLEEVYREVLARLTGAW